MIDGNDRYKKNLGRKSANTVEISNYTKQVAAAESYQQLMNHTIIPNEEKGAVRKHILTK